MLFDCKPVGLRAGLCRAVAAATALALAAAGCSYRSTYVAPPDGRARVVWGAGDVPTVQMSGAELSGQCSVELHDISEHPGRPYRPAHVELNSVPPQNIYVTGGSGYWSPRPIGISSGVGSVARSGGSVARGGGGGSFGGGKDAGAIVLILAVIAAMVLPAVALGLAASMPESNGKASSAIDMVNSYNDLARLDGTPCTPVFEPALFPPPQEQPR